MIKYEFGNNPAKTERYKIFWKRADTDRPLTGFSLVGWFPMQEFAVCREWEGKDYLTPEMIEPRAFLDDHLRILREGEIMDDDVIRGACPAQVAVPWIPGMLGCPTRILPDNVLGDERCLPWEEALAVRLDPENPWYRKYMEFAGLLVETSAGRFPISHGPEIGPTDLHAVLRGHTQCVLDLIDEPEKSSRLLRKLGEIFRDLAEIYWRRIPLFAGGFFDAQYSLWSPGPIVRLQEDAIAVYSPELYRDFIQPVDRMIAGHFSHSFMHLHSTSMFLLDDFLAIEELAGFEINNDAVGPPVAEMLPYFQKVQRAGKPLIIRGAFTPDELRLLMDSLEPRGLFMNMMVKSLKETESLRPIVGI